MFEICCILIQVQNNVTDELLKVMDDFASQLKDILESSKNLSSLVILTKNVGLRTDRLETRKKVSLSFVSSFLARLGYLIDLSPKLWRFSGQ